MFDSYLPLLAKGYNTNLNGSGDTIPAAATAINVNNVFDTGRGDVVSIDVIQTNRFNGIGASSGIEEDGTIDVAIGGVQVIANAEISDFAITNSFGRYNLTPLATPGGQTLQLATGARNGAFGVQFLGFYYNRFNTPENWGRLNVSKLKRRYQDFIFTGAGGLKNDTSTQFTVPQNQGKVIGISLLSYETAAGGTQPVALNTGTVTFNGVNVFENVLIAYGNGLCSRPNLFPVEIAEGTTFNFNVDSSRTAGTYKFGVRLYFDQGNA